MFQRISQLYDTNRGLECLNWKSWACENCASFENGLIRAAESHHKTVSKHFRKHFDWTRFEFMSYIDRSRFIKIRQFKYQHTIELKWYMEISDKVMLAHLFFLWIFYGLEYVLCVNKVWEKPQSCFCIGFIYNNVFERKLSHLCMKPIKLYWTGFLAGLKANTVLWLTPSYSRHDDSYGLQCFSISIIVLVGPDFIRLLKHKQHQTHT